VGSLIGLLLSLALSSTAIADSGAVELAVYVPDGNPRIARPADIVVITHRGGVAAEHSVPTLTTDSGEVLGPAEAQGPGRWRFRIVATAPKPITLTVRAGLTVIRRTIGPPTLPVSRVNGPAAVDGVVGQPVTFALRDSRSPTASADQIRVHVPDGTAEVISDEAGQLSVRWTPGTAPFPRAVPIGVHDLRTPRIAPAWTVVHLFGYPRIPIRTEPGARVDLRIGGRSYGPWTADADGNVEARPEVRPGEGEATVLAEDALGNADKSQVVLGGEMRPRIGIVTSGAVVPGRPSPALWVRALTAAGKEWRGAAPECTTTAGDALQLIAEGPSTWRAEVDVAATAVDLRVRCTLGGQSTRMTSVPVATDIPTRLTLRAYPERLTADLPVAEIQAFLVNAAGDRLPSDRIVVRAEHGEVELDAGGLGRDVRGVYRGARAASSRGDTLVAEANLPPGSGGVWSLDIAGAAPNGRERVLIDGRALDRHGRPLGDVTLMLRGSGRSAEVQTNPRGWASIELPWPEGTDVLVVEASAGGLVRRTAILPDDRVARQPGEADLRTELSLTIVPGRIRNMILTAEPRILESGGERGRIVVRLEDSTGTAVADQQVEITASVGEVGTVHARGDGSYEAFYTPPAGMPESGARITASSPDGRFSASTDLQIVPRRFRSATGLHMGGLVGPQGISSPYGGLEHDLRLPIAPFVMRASIGYYQLKAESFDSIAGVPVRMNLRVLPIGLGLLARRDDAIVPTWIGGELVLAPHRIEAWLGDQRVAAGVDVAPPGLRVLSGLGWRLRSGEVQAQVGYLFVYGTRTGIGWNGPIGGVVGTLGYKVLY
jgi:hypothetical protein